jgi:hypothetical protein
MALPQTTLNIFSDRPIFLVVETTLEPRKAKPREPTGGQRLRMLAARLALDPRELASRIRRAHCAACRTELTYVRRYFEKQHCCERCAPKLDAPTLAALAELEHYL